jgi:hypothetical protein
MNEPILAIARHFEACAAALNIIEANNIRMVKKLTRAA